jgi:hypothetical protein
MYGGRRQALGPVAELLQRQDVTQIQTRQLNEDVIAKIRDLVSQAGSEVISVEHPADRLETLFLRVVGEAQREKLQTSGAEATVGVSRFLAGQGEADGDVSLVEALVRAGQAPEPEQAAPTTEPVEAVPQPREDVIASLTAGKEEGKRAPDAPSAGEPVESPMPEQEPDRAVLDRLLKPDRPPDEGQAEDAGGSDSSDA